VHLTTILQYRKGICVHALANVKCLLHLTGSDQPTKNEIPPDVQKASKFVCDLVRQCSRLGELRTGIQSGLMKETDVYAEIGDVVRGAKKGREGDELILVDLTGTGAQDAAIGQVAWDTLGRK
jgi:ornithine cyclodeaminase/alanine dehydrogenase-like protein (mu-crystallin family)